MKPEHHNLCILGPPCPGCKVNHVCFMAVEETEGDVIRTHLPFRTHATYKHY